MSTQGDFFNSGTEAKLKAISRLPRGLSEGTVALSCPRLAAEQYISTRSQAPAICPLASTTADCLKMSKNSSAIAEGSARRALAIPSPFDEYVFVEQSMKKASELARLTAEYPALEKRIRTIRGEANNEVVRFCKSTNWDENRAVLFLDPFGNQVNWETIARIAKCPIDLWYLFPAHLGINRQVSNSGVVEDEKAMSLDRVYGTAAWREKFLVRESVPQLDGSERELFRKQLNADIATRFMIDRMKAVFEGGVVDAWLPLGRNGAHWYSLLFASGNPKGAAAGIAQKIAAHIMSRR